MKQNKKRHYLVIFIYIACLCFFSWKCLETGEQSSESSNFVGEIIAKALHFLFNIKIVEDSNYSLIIRKLVGHYGFFVIIGFFSFFTYYLIEKITLKKRYLIHFISGLSFALLTEFVFEFFTSGRGASIVDAGIDYLGFCTLSIPLAVYYFIKRKEVANKCL